jgi:hypothetical protein
MAALPKPKAGGGFTCAPKRSTVVNERGLASAWLAERGFGLATRDPDPTLSGSL